MKYANLFCTDVYATPDCGCGSYGLFVSCFSVGKVVRFKDYDKRINVKEVMQGKPRKSRVTVRSCELFSGDAERNIVGTSQPELAWQCV
jgi:hypothetical protein